MHENDAHLAEGQSRVYRAALGLILAQRRPSYYLQTNRDALDDLIDATLDRLEEAGVISPALRDATKAATLKFLPEAPQPPQPPYIEQKAVNALRTHLLNLLGLKKLYEVDRLDLTARTTLDQRRRAEAGRFPQEMGDKEFSGIHRALRLPPAGPRQRSRQNQMERRALRTRRRTATRSACKPTTIDEPFDMNEGMKLDLGSTAKLRTLVDYLEIIGELHRRYAGL